MDDTDASTNTSSSCRTQNTSTTLTNSTNNSENNNNSAFDPKRAPNRGKNTKISKWGEDYVSIGEGDADDEDLFVDEYNNVVDEECHWNESDIADENFQMSSELDNSFSSWLRRVLTSNVVSDGPIRIRGINILDGVEVVRLLKFMMVTFCLIVLVHFWVRSSTIYEFDPNYSLKDFLLFDTNLVLLDIITFFVIGRLYKRRGIDRIFPTLLPMAIGSVYPTFINQIWFLKHSLSMYEIVCKWPWQLYIYISIMVPVIFVILWLHVKNAIHEKILISRLMEAALLATFFLLPFGSNPSFHLHHWYFCWFLGMQLNQEKWWSQLALAFNWGQYINGIAVYGRDPILTCAYGYYVSTDIRCAYMQCNMHPSTNTTHTDYKPFDSPDWRNCSSANAP